MTNGEKESSAKSGRRGPKRELAEPSVSRALAYAYKLKWTADEMLRLQEEADRHRLQLTAAEYCRSSGNHDWLSGYAEKHGLFLVKPSSTESATDQIIDYMSACLRTTRERRDSFARELLVCARGKRSIDTLIEIVCSEKTKPDETRKATLRSRDVHLVVGVHWARCLLQSIHRGERDFEHMTTLLRNAARCLCFARELQRRMPGRSSDNDDRGSPQIEAMAEGELEKLLELVESNDYASAMADTAKWGGPHKGSICLAAKFCGMTYAAVRKVVEKNGDLRPETLLLGVRLEDVPLADSPPAPPSARRSGTGGNRKRAG